MADEILYAGLLEQARLVRSGELSSVELTTLVLDRIRAVDPGLGAFRVVSAGALDEAAARDAQRDDRGPLHGVPIAIKDENDVAGEVTTYGGSAQSAAAREDSEAVRRLRQAGAVIVGKTRMPEFGQWPYTESVAFGISRNPWDRTRTPGGSSGGSAIAVATGMVAAALGGDGGGSIRIPAAWCGLFGLKPQRGRVSAAPYDALWGTLGTMGPLTRSVADSALFYDVVSGTVDADRWGAAPPPIPYAELLATPLRPLRIGIIRKAGVPGIPVDRSQSSALSETAALLSDLGHDVSEAARRLPNHGPAFMPQYFDAVRDEATHVDHPERLERRTRQNLRVAHAFPAATVRWAARRGDRLAAKADGLFARYDLLLTPTVPTLPPPTGILDGIGWARALWRSTPAVAFTGLWNVTGHPAAAVPAGFSGNLPLSVQLIGPQDGEGLILQLAAQLEQARPWADRRPV